MFLFLLFYTDVWPNLTRRSYTTYLTVSVNLYFSHYRQFTITEIDQLGKGSNFSTVARMRVLAADVISFCLIKLKMVENLIQLHESFGIAHGLNSPQSDKTKLRRQPKLSCMQS
jgi:hypothetical protein